MTNDIRKLDREAREAVYQSFKRGYQMGAQGLPVLADLGTPPPWSMDDYRRGWEAGTAAYKMAMEDEAGRMGLVEKVKAIDLESRGFGVLAAAVGWWKAHRPIGWTNADHLNNPTINAHATDNDKLLAMAVGRWATDLGEPIP